MSARFDSSPPPPEDEGPSEAPPPEEAWDALRALEEARHETPTAPDAPAPEEPAEAPPEHSSAPPIAAAAAPTALAEGAGRWALYSAAWVAAAPLEEVPMLVPALAIGRGRPCCLAGGDGAGKNDVAQAIALGVATGRPIWGGIACAKGRVLHVSYDLGRYAVALRYRRLAAGMGLRPEELIGQSSPSSRRRDGKASMGSRCGLCGTKVHELRDVRRPGVMRTKVCAECAEVCAAAWGLEASPPAAVTQHSGDFVGVDSERLEGAARTA